MKLVLLSDLHISVDRMILGREPIRLLYEAVDHMTQHHADADLCLILGDLTENGLAEEYRALKIALDSLRTPYLPILGNHDDRGVFLEIFGREQADSQGFVETEVDVGRHRCILLDTHLPGEGGGGLDQGQLARLNMKLSLADRPCLLFLHHPPIDTALPAFEGIGLRNRTEFAALLAKHHQKIAGIFFGHTHMSLAGTVAGIPTFGMRSLVCQSLQSFSDCRFLAGPGLPSAYGIVIETVQGITVHTVEFGYEGPIVASGKVELTK